LTDQKIPAASVLIPTRNRKQMLGDTVRSVLQQSIPVEVIIVDDGSTDGTAEHIRAEFPPGQTPVRLIRHEHSFGPTAARNEAANLARAEFLFTIDDDCLVLSRFTFEQTLGGFDHPRVGAVTIPFVNIHQSQTVYYRAPDDRDRWIGFMFFGGMVAFRRSAYQAVGGYRTYYFMHVEEPDLSIRLLQAGFVVRLGIADPIHHLESPSRNVKKLHVLGPRNHLLYHWYNTPMPVVLARLPIAAASTLVHTFRLRRPDLGVIGLIRGVCGIVHEGKKRDPVQPDLFRLSRELARQPQPLSAVEPRLGQMLTGPA
jgi:glycosyltransferase involved in cell wall biosynthesis